MSRGALAELRATNFAAGDRIRVRSTIGITLVMSNADDVRQVDEFRTTRSLELMAVGGV